MSNVVRLVLADGAAGGTLRIGRAAYAREEGRPMAMIVAVGAVLVGVCFAFALSV